MKYLSDYTEELQTAAFKKHGAIFAFSDAQFEEQREQGIEYTSLGHGLIAPKANAKQLLEDMRTINKNGIEKDIQENGIDGIIWRELANHEAQITNDTESTVFALDGYGIPIEKVQEVFKKYMKHCIENDLF